MKAEDISTIIFCDSGGIMLSLVWFCPKRFELISTQTRLPILQATDLDNVNISDALLSFAPTISYAQKCIIRQYEPTEKNAE